MSESQCDVIAVVSVWWHGCICFILQRDG